MTRTDLTRPIIVAFAAMFAMALVPPAAMAVTGPAFSSRTIMSEGFEGAAPARLTLEPMVSGGYPTSAYWGPITQQKHAGTSGLWCAGRIPNSASTTAWTAFGGKYPNYTAGLATLTLPELGDYYSAKLDFWYRMPTPLGSADGEAFNVLWSSTVGGTFWDYHVGWPVTSTWRHETLDMSVPTPVSFYRPVNLSRTPGMVRFQFTDDVSAYESPQNGEGPTIDDVTVSGFKYGPVREVRATSISADAVALAWTKPARSTAIAGDDTRTITYHVWRSRDAQPYSWTEVGTGFTGTTCTDSSPKGGAWRYVVQAWDPSPGTGYGELETSAGVPVLVDTAPESTIVLDPASPGSDGLYVVPPTVTVTREFEGATYWRWGSGAFTRETAVSFQVPSPVTTDTTRTLEVYSTNTLGTEETPHKFVTYSLGGVDGTPPTTTWVGAVATYVAKASIVLTATDVGGLGVAETWWSFDGGAPRQGTVLSTTKPGAHTLEFWSVDKAGNKEPPVTKSFTVLTATRLSITSDHTSIVHRHAVKLSGIITPNVYAGTHIEVWVLRPGSHAYTRLTTRHSYAYHHWSYTYYPATAGKWYFKVKLPQTTRYAPSESTYRRITVR